MNNTDATWHFRDVPFINSACKFQLIGSLHCDNRTIYIKNACKLQNAAALNWRAGSAIFCLKPQF